MSGYFIGKAVVEIAEGAIYLPREISKIDVKFVDLVFTVWEKENGDWDSVMIYMKDSWMQHMEELAEQILRKEPKPVTYALLTERKIAVERTNEYGEVKLPSEILNRLWDEGETSVVLLGSMQKKLEMIGKKRWEAECDQWTFLIE